jgi:hypothetical protein
MPPAAVAGCDRVAPALGGALRRLTSITVTTAPMSRAAIATTASATSRRPGRVRLACGGGGGGGGASDKLVNSAGHLHSARARVAVRERRRRRGEGDHSS